MKKVKLVRVLFLLLVLFEVITSFEVPLHALTANVTNLFYSLVPSETLTPGIPTKFIVQTRNSSSTQESLDSSLVLVLESTSSTGAWYNASIGGGCTSQISGNSITMNSGTSQKAFCYSDTTPGTHTVTAHAPGITSVSGSVTVEAPSTPSYTYSVDMGTNTFTENTTSTIPLVFSTTDPDGKSVQIDITPTGYIELEDSISEFMFTDESTKNLTAIFPGAGNYSVNLAFRSVVDNSLILEKSFSLLVTGGTSSDPVALNEVVHVEKKGGGSTLLPVHKVNERKVFKRKDEIVESEVVEGEVLGEFSGSTLCPLLRSYLSPYVANRFQDVEKLQAFLNIFEGEMLSIDGMYEVSTRAAVERYQEKYREEIMTPWIIKGHSESSFQTGSVYLTTRKHINERACPTYTETIYIPRAGE